MKLSKNIALLLLVVALCVITNPIVNNLKTVKATSYTSAQGIAWVQGKVGQAIDDDGVYGAQCVDLIRAYYKYLGVAAVSGNGKNYATNALPAGWSRVQGGTPKKGDILVYSGNNVNPYGHVAIYESDYVTYHQNFNNVQRVQKITSIKYNGCSNPYWGYIRPNWSSGGNNPQGVIDECTGKDGAIYVRGWAFDKDSSSSSINVDVYIGGPAGTAGVAGYRLNANGTRDDVNKVYGISGKHGYAATLSTTKTGSVPIYIYAINVGGGQNVLLGSRTVNVTAYNPQGCIDFCNGGDGSITTQGWAFDRSDISKSIEVHAYIGGYASGSSAEGHRINANTMRNDVNKAYGISGKHGFYNTIKTNKRGKQIVTFYAINTGAGGNVYLGNRTVTIKELPKTTNHQTVKKNTGKTTTVPTYNTKKVSKILLTSKKKITIKKGKKGKITITFKANGTIYAKSKNKKIASVKWAKGWNGNKAKLYIKGKKKGTTKIVITNTYNGEKVIIKVKVKKKK